MYVGIQACQHQQLYAPPIILELIMHCEAKSPVQTVMLLIINGCFYYCCNSISVYLL
jgi:hypothetical protein